MDSTSSGVGQDLHGDLADPPEVAGSLVVYEHHYDEQQNGGPLTSDDLSFDTANLS
jgi:hypothetical protein